MNGRHRPQTDHSGTTRRQLLQQGAAAAAVGLLPGTAAIGADDLTMHLIDAHSHIWTPEIRRYPLAEGFRPSDMQPPSFTAAELMAHAKPCGVSRVVLIQMSFYGTDNSYMLDMMRNHPGVFSGVAVVDESADPARKMRELARHGVRGFRIRPGNQKPESWLKSDGMQAMWRCGADNRLAMCLLIDPNCLPAVERMCEQFPQTPVVIDHFARIGVDGSIRDTDLDHLCRLAEFPEVTVKVSAFYALGQKVIPYDDLGPMVRRLLGAYGADRLMWGSDCPYQVQQTHTYRASVDLIRSRLGFLTTHDRDAILRKTAERVFFS